MLEYENIRESNTRGVGYTYSKFKACTWSGKLSEVPAFSFFANKRFIH